MALLNRICPKCNFGDIDTTHLEFCTFGPIRVSQYTMTLPHETTERDVLRMMCSRCNAAWHVLPMDTENGGMRVNV